MPVLLSPSIDPTTSLQASHGVAALINLRGLHIGRIRLGAPGDADRWPDNPSEFKAIITNWRLVERVMAQIEPSLADDVYIWSSGDAHDDITIEGLAVQADCRAKADQRHGFSHVLDFYRKNRLSARETSVVLQIGDVTIQSRLLSIQLTGVPNTNLAPFAMTFVGSPPPRRRALGDEPAVAETPS